MTSNSGYIATERAEEIEHYVEAVREALADLPQSQRDELLEDLPAHLMEAAAEDPTPLVDRLGWPADYAAELRAAVAPAMAVGRPTWSDRWAARWEVALGRLRRLDGRVGPLIGYERFSDFARLLLPAWWVLRGYLAAMLVVTLLDRQGSIGLLPRLGGSTLAGLVILAGFVAGSIWLAHRSSGLRRWQRRALYLTTAVLILVGIAGLAGIDANSRWGWPGPAVYISDNPYEHVEDVFVVDEDGQVLTNVRLLDQDGDPIDLGWAWCEETTEVYDEVRDEWSVRFPRCPDRLPWWTGNLTPTEGPAQPTPTPTPAPSPSPAPGPSLTPEPSVTPTPAPSPTPSS